MITLHTWTTPNGRKASIMLEELGVPYKVHAVDIGKGAQFEPAFLAVSPNNKIPAIVDDDANGKTIAVFESGAILQYLAEKTGRFLPSSGPERYKTLEWLYWQVGGLGPMLGQLGFFSVFSKEKLPSAIERFRTEADRLLGVMERRLSETNYLGGDEYSIADMAAYPWVLSATTFLAETLSESMSSKPQVLAWLKRIGERPAVQRGMLIPDVFKDA